MENGKLSEIGSNNIPLPICIIDENGKVIEKATRIGEVFLYDEIEGADILALTGISYEQLKEAADEEENIIFNSSEKKFEIAVAALKENSKQLILYFIDVTDLEKVKDAYRKEENVICIVQIDNYDELVNSTAEDDRALLVSKIDKCVRAWGQTLQASVTRYKQAMYLVLIERDTFEQQERSRFPILDEVREIETEIDFPITLSLGFGLGGSTPSERDHYAVEAMDLALARGGDQAVVKEGEKISFYGGKTQTVEKGNKGKSRIIGHALMRLIDNSKNVIIMGHANPDMDAFGAALGIYRLARPRNKNTFILINEYNDALTAIYRLVEETGEYEIIKNSRALKITDEETLVVVVDTHRPSITECPEILTMAGNIAVIDHHRKGEEFIKNPTLAYTEPYASSASELVAEILQYTIDRRDLARLEAEALLAGIMVDTNRFSVKAGVRTFEAAAWLKRAGADTAEVKRFFQVNPTTFEIRAACVAAAKVDDNGFAYSICKGENENAQIINSQVADELLTVTGVKASFVAGKDEYGRTVISARSIGEFNVQIILEKMGGGGHLNTAGAQVDTTPEEAIDEIKRLLETEL